MFFNRKNKNKNESKCVAEIQKVFVCNVSSYRKQRECKHFSSDNDFVCEHYKLGYCSNWRAIREAKEK